MNSCTVRNMCLFAKPSSRSTAVENSNKRQTVKENNTTRTEQQQQTNKSISQNKSRPSLFHWKKNVGVTHNKQNLHVRKIHTVTYRQGYYHNPTHSEYVLLMEMRRKINSITHINPFTAPVCKSSGLKDAGTSLETVFSTSAFSAVRFDKSLSHVSATFFLQISHFCRSFSSGIMAVKQLIWLTYNRHCYIIIAIFTLS